MRVIFSVLIISIILAACTAKSQKFVVPETSLTINIPDDWKRMDDNQLNNMTENSKGEGLPKNFKEDIKVLNEGKKYIFLKSDKVNGKDRNYNVAIFVMALNEDVNIDQIAEAQAQDISASLQGKVELDNCPKLTISQYRCHKTELEFDGSKVTQYQYITTNNKKFVQFSFTLFDGLDSNYMVKVITSIGTKSP